MTVGDTLAQLADAAGIDYLYNGQYGVITDRNGLYYMRARYYDQDIKRFTNRDVVSGDITNSRSLNRYCYVQGNPVSLTDPFGLCPDPNSNFKNFCRTLYCVDWNAVGHGALDVMGIFCDGADVLNAIWYACEGKTKEALTSALCALPGLGMGIGSLMEKTSKFAQAGKTVKYLSRMTQGGMGVVAGISMAKTGFTNILNGLESGNLSGWDVVTFIGGIAITGLSGRNLAISGRGLAGMMDDAGKVAKAGKAENAIDEVSRDANTSDIFSRKVYINGKDGETELANMFGGRPQVYFKTSQGGRYIDQLADGIAHESKVGYTTLSKRIKIQVLKDAELIKMGKIDGAHWHFFTSGVTGRGGASQPLLDFLTENGIEYTIH